MECKAKTQNTKNRVEAKSVKIALPDWHKIVDFKFSNLVFDKTREQEFNKLYPFIKDFEDSEENIRIYTYRPEATTSYSSVKIGFEDGVLSWIDYCPSRFININDIIDIFGTPLAINNNVSKYLDYYDYGRFSISVSKDKGNVYVFTQHGNEDNNYNDAKDINIKLPAWKDLAAGKVDKLVPGATKKSSLKVLYPKLKESSLGTQYYPKDYWVDEEEVENTLPSIYLINKGLESTEYKSVELVFKKKILSWIDLVPKKLSLDQALKAFGSSYKIDSTANVDFYNFKNLVLTVAKSNKSILNIGVLGSVNSQLRTSLPSLKNLNAQGFKGLKIDTTTKIQFNKTFPSLISQIQREGNIETYKISEGISSTDYDTIYFVFKKNILSSIDFVPRKQIKIGDIVKFYGKKYDLDNKSDKQLDYYTFAKVIVSVSKESKIVNSIGYF